MAEFLTTNGTSYHIENIIIEAKGDLFLVSPYLQISKTLYERLKDASGRGVKIRIIYGKDDLKPNERDSLAELKNLELFYFENLHAKCYYNEQKMVITSMNMYEFSEKNNREMGVLIDKNSDKDLYEKAVNETNSIIKSSEVHQLRKIERNSFSFSKTKEQQPTQPARGYCLRCESRIPFDVEKPYCYDCYAVWASYSNPDFQESVCHCCGQFENSTMNKPLCYKCYKKVGQASF